MSLTVFLSGSEVTDDLELSGDGGGLIVTPVSVEAGGEFIVAGDEVGEALRFRSVAFGDICSRNPASAWNRGAEGDAEGVTVDEIEI